MRRKINGRGRLSNGLRDLTPAKFACACSASCPAVFEDDEKDSYVIIGKVRWSSSSPDLKGRVGPDETVIEISRELLENAIRPPKSK